MTKNESVKLERLRNFCYLLISVLIILNVLDAGSTGYLVTSYGVHVEQNLLMYLLISNLGLVNFLLLKCVGITFAFLFAWFIIENTNSIGVLSLAIIAFIALYVFYGFVVVVGWSQLPFARALTSLFQQSIIRITQPASLNPTRTTIFQMIQILFGAYLDPNRGRSSPVRTHVQNTFPPIQSPLLT